MYRQWEEEEDGFVGLSFWCVCVCYFILFSACAGSQTKGLCMLSKCSNSELNAPCPSSLFFGENCTKTSLDELGLYVIQNQFLLSCHETLGSHFNSLSRIVVEIQKIKVIFIS